jgi:hypothetical protein
MVHCPAWAKDLYPGRPQAALLRRLKTNENVLRQFSFAQVQEENPCEIR